MRSAPARLVGLRSKTSLEVREPAAACVSGPSIQRRIHATAWQADSRSRRQRSTTGNSANIRFNASTIADQTCARDSCHFCTPRLHPRLLGHSAGAREGTTRRARFAHARIGVPGAAACLRRRGMPLCTTWPQPGSEVPSSKARCLPTTWAALNKAYDAAWYEKCRKAGSYLLLTSTDAAGPANLWMSGATVRGAVFLQHLIRPFPLPIMWDIRRVVAAASWLRVALTGHCTLGGSTSTELPQCIHTN
jgi:hypothetical protein